MGFLTDNLIPIFKKTELTFKEKIQESDQVYTFVFDKVNIAGWKAGQYGLISIAHKKMKNGTKPFSLASAPNENDIRITTVIGSEPSEFKKALLELEPGMKVSMSGPLGPFYLKGSSPVVLIAAGIGITPIRSMVKQLEAEGTGASRPIQLLYVDSQRPHLFRDELDGISGAISMNVNYLNARDELYQELEKLSAAGSGDKQYYIAGPKSMVDEIVSYLQNKKVSKKNITKDAFFGY